MNAKFACPEHKKNKKHGGYVGILVEVQVTLISRTINRAELTNTLETSYSSLLSSETHMRYDLPAGLVLLGHVDDLFFFLRVVTY